MRQRFWQILGILAAAGAVVALRAAPAVQAQAQNPDTLAALLVEVRGLRGAMEQMASAGPRIQLATARLQLQEQRINALVRRLESTRDTLASAQQDLTEQQERVRQFEEARKNPDTPEGVAVAEVIATVKRAIATQTTNVQRLQADEAQLSQEIATEQARWNDINQRLDELDRALGNRR